MKYLLSLILLLGASLVQADDLVIKHDLEALPRFAETRVVDHNQQESAERIYPRSSIQRISSRLRYSNEVVVEGAYQSVTYELPATHDAVDIFNGAREILQGQGAELLFWCEGRECGSSSLWANAIFSRSALYGLDDRQAYALFRLAEPNHESLLALYAVTRGNRRGYLHVEQANSVKPLGELLPTPATLLRQLRTDGKLNMPAVATAESAWVGVVARALAQDATLRISLNGDQAAAWREALVGQRVREGRLEIGSTQAPGLQIQQL